MLVSLFNAMNLYNLLDVISNFQINLDILKNMYGDKFMQANKIQFFSTCDIFTFIFKYL